MFVVYVCYPASCPGVPGSTRVGMLRDLRRTRRVCAVYRISNAKLRGDMKVGCCLVLFPAPFFSTRVQQKSIFIIFIVNRSEVG